MVTGTAVAVSVAPSGLITRTTRIYSDKNGPCSFPKATGKFASVGESYWIKSSSAAWDTMAVVPFAEITVAVES